MILNWNTTEDEQVRITLIAHRASALAKRMGVKYSVQDASMDITAVHCNDLKLDLAGLGGADEGNFGHDVFGIRRHINRDTGKLKDCFVPRYAEKRVEVKQ